MPSTPSTTLARDLRSLAREQWKHVDRPGWRRFFLALLGLAISFSLALYATALHDAGRYELAATVAAVSLLLAGIVGAKSVPYLARRTALGRWMIKIEYEFTREGAVYLGMVAIITVAALNTGNNLLFMMLACLLAGILVSGIVSLIVLSGLELELELPEHLFAEQPTVLRLMFRNKKWVFPSFSISVSDALSKKRRKEADERADAVKRSAYIELAHIFRCAFQGLLRPSRTLRSAPAESLRSLAASGHKTCRILNQPVYIPYLGRRSAVSAEIDVTFPRRGRYAQDGFRLSTKFPFGLLRKSREIPLHREVLVLPNIQPTEEFYEILPLISGEAESLRKGRGHDLYTIRDYRQTDTARHVDWKATAKVQQLKVREFTREDERRVALVFDRRLAAADERVLSRFEKAVTFCACLAWHFYEINAQMRFISESLETPMTSATEIIYPVLESLALVQPIFASSSTAALAAPPASGGDILAGLSSGAGSFNIIVTFRSRGSIPTSLWGSSYVVFGDSL